MTATQASQLAPISQRSPLTFRRKLVSWVSALVFLVVCITVNVTQLIFLLPLRILSFIPWSRPLYQAGMRFTKKGFGCLLILMCQWFAPTKLVISFERKGAGAFTEEQIEQIVVRDKNGEVLWLELDKKFVLISNHQVYPDWWYAWTFLYFVGEQGVHDSIFITLKKTLKWVPVLGWGMIFFDFIFLARSWVTDRIELSKSLSSLGKAAQQEDRPFVFLLYPEGTLVSKDTRPISKKFADKMGIDDMKNALLPRSTGLHFTLRSLAPRIPGLKLIDMTTVYPGVPPMGYGQSWYTLRSIFLNGVPPPAIHLHLRIFDVCSQVPIGASLSKANPTTIPNPASESPVEVEIPESEKTEFDTWLREGLWREKDNAISEWHNRGSFAEQTFDIPLKLRTKKDMSTALGMFPAVALASIYSRIRR